MLNLKSRSTAIKAAVGGVLAAPMLAMAQSAPSTFDTSSVTTAATTIGTIGGVVFLVYVAIKVTQWARRAL